MAKVPFLDPKVARVTKVRQFLRASWLVLHVLRWMACKGLLSSRTAAGRWVEKWFERFLSIV